MRDFKKALLTTGAVLLIVVLFSAAFLWFTAPFTHNYDWSIRETLAGSLDFLIVGASHGQCALCPEVIDEVLGSSSYNLCCNAEVNYEKDWLLRKEFSRNEIKTVVLELSYDELAFETNAFTDANIFSVMRMDSFSDRLPYLLHQVSFENKLFVYAEMMYQGGIACLSPQTPYNEEQLRQRGCNLLPENDHSLPQEMLAAVHHQNWFTVASFKEPTVNGFSDLIRLCQAQGARVVVAVVPVSDQRLWRAENLDAFTEWATAYCAEHNVEYYDFNLLRERFTLFSDTDCYSTDPEHMSGKGAKIFSRVFAEILRQAAEGQDVSDRFYASYSQMQWDSPYMVNYSGD